MEGDGALERSARTGTRWRRPAGRVIIGRNGCMGISLYEGAECAGREPADDPDWIRTFRNPHPGTRRGRVADDLDWRSDTASRPRSGTPVPSCPRSRAIGVGWGDRRPARFACRQSSWLPRHGGRGCWNRGRRTRKLLSAVPAFRPSCRGWRPRSPTREATGRHGGSGEDTPPGARSQAARRGCPRRGGRASSRRARSRPTGGPRGLR